LTGAGSAVNRNRRKESPNMHTGQERERLMKDERKDDLHIVQRLMKDEKKDDLHIVERLMKGEMTFT